MAKFIEVEVKCDMRPMFGGIFRFEEKKDENPRFFEMIVNPEVVQFITYLQKKIEEGKEIKDYLMINLLIAYGIRIKEVRITGYKKEKFKIEAVAVDEDGQEKVVSCNISDAMVLGLPFKAKILVSEEVFKKVITAAEEAAKKVVERAKEEFEKRAEQLREQSANFTQMPLPEKPKKVKKETSHKRDPAVV